jgi:hypothetical protein
MNSIESWKDYTHTIEIAGHALFAVCKSIMTVEELLEWKNGSSANNFIDANQVLIDILDDLGIDIDIEDPEMNKLWHDCWNKAIALNQSKNYMGA